MPTIIELGRRVKAKYPEYKDMPDIEVGRKVKAKYPQDYADFEDVAQSADLGQMAMGAAKGVVVNPIAGAANLAGEFGKRVLRVGDEALKGNIGGAADALLEANPLYMAYEVGKGALKGHANEFRQAGEALRQGDYMSAAGHALYGAMPLVGPAMSQSMAVANDPNKSSFEKGEALGDVAANLIPGVSGLKKMGPTARLGKKANQADIDFMKRREIPMSVSDATDNSLLRASQQLAGSGSLTGSNIAVNARDAKRMALRKTMSDLADETGAPSTTPYLAGQNIQKALKEKSTKELKPKAELSYADLEDIEAINQKWVMPDGRIQDKPTFGGKDAAVGRYAAGRVLVPTGERKVGTMEVPKSPEPHHPYGATGLRQMVPRERPSTAEIPKKVQPSPYGPTGRKSIETEVVPSTRIDYVPGAELRGRETRDVYSSGYEQGDWHPAPQRLGMPIDVRSVQDYARGMVEFLERQWKDTDVQGAQVFNQQIKSLKSIIDGPSFMSLSEADRNVSKIKAMIRESEMATKATMTGGEILDQMETLIADSAMKYGGQKAVTALQKGRAYWKAAAEVEEDARKLLDEPVQAFKQTQYAGDAGVDYLKRLQQHAPQQMGELGRAYLEDLFTKSMADGGVNHTQLMKSSWDKLGPQTKAILFPNPAHRKDLDSFFRIVDKQGRVLNTSRTAEAAEASQHLKRIGSVGGALAYTGGGLEGVLAAFAAAEVGGGLLAKAMYSPKFVAKLTEGYKLPAGSAAQKLVIANLIEMARERGGQE